MLHLRSTLLSSLVVYEYFICSIVVVPTERIEWNSHVVVVRASASQSVDLRFILIGESYRKTVKNGIYSLPAWRSAFRGGCGEQAGKFACCVLGQGT